MVVRGRKNSIKKRIIGDSRVHGAHQTLARRCSTFLEATSFFTNATQPHCVENMDKSTFERLSQINDDLVLHLQWLLEKKDLDAVSKLIPIVDRLTHLLIEIGQKETR
jgi:hypothetical protein